MPISSDANTADNVYLSKHNAHPRDAYIQFDEGPHIYTVHGEQGYTSVTTFIHSHFEHFDAEACIDMILKGKAYRTDPAYKYYGMTREAIRTQWSQSGTEASGLGTKLHYEIECFMNQELVDAETDEPVDATHQQLAEVWMEEHGDTLTTRPIEWKYFLDFVHDFPGLRPYRTEWFIFDEVLKLAGSIDMVYKNEDDTYSIYDWKRSKEIKYNAYRNKCAITPSIGHLPDTNFWHYSLQLNLYKAMLERNYNIRIRDLYLIVLHPDASAYERIACHDLQHEITILLKERQTQIDIKQNNDIIPLSVQCGHGIVGHN